MKLKLVFGLGGRIKFFEHGGEIESFHKELLLEGRKYVHKNYRPDANKEFDYIIHFEDAGKYDQTNGFITDWDSISSGIWAGKCECGATYGHSAPGSHSLWCPKYQRTDWGR